jgi:vacuolar protein sorting-associated protein 13A/C
MQFPRTEGLSSHQYTVAIRLTPEQSLSTEWQLHQQSARTCGNSSDNFLSSDLELVNWNEVFFFKVDSLVCR